MAMTRSHLAMTRSYPVGTYLEVRIGYVPRGTLPYLWIDTSLWPSYLARKERERREIHRYLERYLDREAAT